MTEAVEFADNSPEPPLDSLYDHLYVSATRSRAGTASTSARPTRIAAEEERGATERARELAERGAAYAGGRGSRARPEGDQPDTRPEDVH